MSLSNADTRSLINSLRPSLDTLSTRLATIQNKIKIESMANDYSLNLLMETKMLQILNLTYGYGLKNTNLSDRNSPGIDGSDTDLKIMVQVTASDTTKKIDNTLDRIINHGVYTDYDRLILVLLNDKKSFTDAYKRKVAKKIGGRFRFDPNQDIIELGDIYRSHHIGQDLGKIHMVIGLLEEVLGYRPEGKSSGFLSLSVSFHDEELENVYWLIDALIREGVNVYINSQKIYQRFHTERHQFSDFIILSDQQNTVEHIQYCLTILSNNYIKDNFTDPSPRACRLLKGAREAEAKIEVISFDPFVNRVTSDRSFNMHIMARKETVQQTVKRILQDIMKSASFGNIQMEEVKQELININKIFSTTTINDNDDYSLLNLKMKNQHDMEMNYLIMTRDHRQSNAIQHFDQYYKKNYSKNLNILVPKDFSHKTRRRLDAFKILTDRVHYIDEHLFDQRYRTFQQERITGTEDFVNPVVRMGDEYKGVNDILHWIINDADSSVAILTGSGGIGKTTVCEKIHNRLLDYEERIIVIFIDAKRYIEVFRNNGSTAAVYDLYNIFAACHPQANLIDQNSFYVNYALGNIVIIFDGIDEVISTIPSFSLNKFLSTLRELKMIIGKGKILISCRDAYVTDLRKLYDLEENDVRNFELLAFDVELAKRFFSKHFKQEQQIKDCLKLANEFFPDEQLATIHRYPPFILEIIIQMVDENFNYEDIIPDQTSMLLNYKETFDMIIAQVCQREIMKKEEHGFQLDIHHQIKFFCLIALEEQGLTSTKRFPDFLQQVGHHDRLEEVANGLQDHPFLLTNNDDGLHRFRFEFFQNNFQALAVLNIIQGKLDFPVNQVLLNTIAYECHYNSVISKIIVDRLRTDRPELNRLIANTKSVLQNGMSEGRKTPEEKLRVIRKKFASNLFLLLLKATEGQIDSRSLIDQLFKNADGWILNFCLFDIPDEAAITLDFRGLIFTSSFINNYSRFFYCKADDDTFFDDSCAIDNVYSNKLHRRAVEFNLENFDKNIKGDNSVFRILSLRKDKEIDHKKFFIEYLRPFRQIRIFVERDERSIEIGHDDSVTVDILTKFMMEDQILVRSKSGKLAINERLRVKVTKFLDGGLMFNELKRSVNRLKTALLSGTDVQ